MINKKGIIFSKYYFLYKKNILAYNRTGFSFKLLHIYTSTYRVCEYIRNLYGICNTGVEQAAAAACGLFLKKKNR